MILYSDTGIHFQRQKEREKHGYSDIHIHAILALIYAFTQIDREKHREKSEPRDDTIHERSVTI